MQLNTNSLHTRFAVVTGASSGIGKAIAETLIAYGAIVVNADIEDPSDHPASPRYHFHKTDITNATDVAGLYNFVAGMGTPNILICNAGRGIHEKLEEGDPEKWAHVIDINLTGTLRILRSFLPALTSQKQPDIVFISSVAAQKAYEYGGVYSATKAGIEMIADTLRLELKERARITVIAPGVVDTKFFTHLESGVLDAETIGCGKLEADEISDAVLYAITRKPAQAVSFIAIRPRNQSF